MSIVPVSGLAFQPFGWDDSIKKSIYTGPLTWASGLTYLIDPTINNQLLEMENIQSVFCNNQSSGIVTIVVQGTNFTLNIPASSQGVYPLICSDRPVFSITCSVASGTTQLWFTNAQALGFSYANTTASSVTTATGNGGVVYPASVGNVIKQGSFSGSGGNLITGNPGYVITGVQVFVTAQATQSTAGLYGVYFADSVTGVILEFPFQVGTTASGAVQTASTYPGFFWNNKTSNSVWSINSTASLTAGACYYHISYATATYVG